MKLTLSNVQLCVGHPDHIFDSILLPFISGKQIFVVPLSEGSVGAFFLPICLLTLVWRSF